FIYLRIQGRQYIVMSDLEIDRAKREAPGCKVLSLSACQDKASKDGAKNPRMAEVIRSICREKGVRQVTVPGNFPLALAVDLENLVLKVREKDGYFFPQRERKSADEVKKLSAALRTAEAGMAEGMRVLRASKIGAGAKLLYQGKPLTSERLRSAI